MRQRCLAYPPKEYTMSRYTVDKSNPSETNSSLFNVLDNGVPIEAFAEDGVEFGDKCEITGGEFHGGRFHGGRFHGGVFCGGWFFGGEFHGGEFHGGAFHGGVFFGGVFRGGVFFGGAFHGGSFNGGSFHYGEFREGWLPLQVRGSKHFLNIPDGKSIKIGCIELPPEVWKTEFEKIGKEHGYSESQRAEYKVYIDLATKLIEANTLLSN